MSKANRRFYRSILLALATLGVLLWAAIARFGIARREMAELLLATVWIALGTIVLALLSAATWVLIRSVLQRCERD